jgi:hypothetical protein
MKWFKEVETILRSQAVLIRNKDLSSEKALYWISPL